MLYHCNLIRVSPKHGTYGSLGCSKIYTFTTIETYFLSPNRCETPIIKIKQVNKNTFCIKRECDITFFDKFWVMIPNLAFIFLWHIKLGVTGYINSFMLIYLLLFCCS